LPVHPKTKDLAYPEENATGGDVGVKGAIVGRGRNVDLLDACDLGRHHTMTRLEG